MLEARLSTIHRARTYHGNPYDLRCLLYDYISVYEMTVISTTPRALRDQSENACIDTDAVFHPRPRTYGLKGSTSGSRVWKDGSVPSVPYALHLYLLMLQQSH